MFTLHLAHFIISLSDSFLAFISVLRFLFLFLFLLLLLNIIQSFLNACVFNIVITRCFIYPHLF